jgi:8-oxo-dGTP pyrophosphatase MutT (NUDIX family)
MPSKASSEARTAQVTSGTVRRVTRLDLVLKPQPWLFAEQKRAEIEAHFARRQQDKPKLWNGRILMARHAVFTDDSFGAEYFETDFASFLAWRDWGFPDGEVFNGFGMGALLCADGAFVLGEMADFTSNAGQIYFPAGTPDLSDLRGTIVDIPGSVTREVEEETGLTPADYRASDHWDLVVTRGLVAMMRILHVDASGEVLRARIEANLARETAPELCAIHLVRNAGDLKPVMPIFVTAFLEAQLKSTI